MITIVCFVFLLRVFPGLVHDLATVFLALLQDHHVAPIRLVDRIDKATGLDAKSREGLAGRISLHGRHVGALAGIELERRLGTVNLQVDV